MPDIRVTCPTCKTQLEIDAAHEGEEVECGNCLQVFVATTKKPKDAGSSGSGGKVTGSTRSRASRDDDDEDEDERPRRRRRRDDDDDDDDDYDPRPRRRSGGGNGLAVTSLVLGILSIIMACCCGLFSLPLSIGAVVTGAMGMKNQDSKGMAIAGLVMGILAVIIAIVNVAIGLGMNMNNPNRFR